MVTESDARDAVAALDAIPPITGIESISSGSNDSFRITTADETFVAKFNTFSQNRTFRAEARILRYLHDADLLPVPDIVAAKERATTPAPFFVTRYIDGNAPTPLTEMYDRHLVRQMGFAALVLSVINADDVTGYGRITPTGNDGCLEADEDSWREYYRDYIHEVLNDAEWTAPDFLQEYIDPLHDAIDDRIETIPETPDTAIVLPDFRLDNLLVDDDGRVIAVLDFERADLGDPHFTLANTHYLLGRGLSDHLRDRLRDDLAEGFAGWMDAETERTYRLGALAKEVRAFDHWWQNVSDEDYAAHRERMLTDLDDAL